MNIEILYKKDSINFDIIEKSLKGLDKINEYLAQTGIDKIISFSKKLENFYYSKYLKNHNSFLSFNKRIRYLIKYIINHKDIRFKKNDYINNAKDKSLLYIIIPMIKIFIIHFAHTNIKNILLIIIKLYIDKALPYKIFILTIEFILNILINKLNSNSHCFYTINDEPFNIINDIITSLIYFPEEIKTENINNNILIDVINLFDKYFFSHNYINFIFKETSIWLKLMENNLFKSTNINNNFNNNNNKILKNRKVLKEKLNSFLVKIYQFSLRTEYFENIIIKNSIIDLEYYLNTLNFMKQLIWKEIQSIQISDFKIKEGNFIQNNKYIFINDLKPKIKFNEISIIFSFKIFSIETNKDIDIFKMTDQKMKAFVKLYINEKGFLALEQSEVKNLVTNLKIKENSCYFLCISITKTEKKPKGTNGKLFIYQNDTNTNELNNNQISFQLEKINDILSNNISLVLGKNNFFGVIGDFLMINKELRSENIHHLFNLKEDYAKALKKIYYDFKILPIKLSPNYRGGYNETEIYEKAKTFFKKLKFEIIFDLSADEIYNIKSNKLLRNINNNNENDYSINQNENFSINEKDIYLFKNLSKMKYTFDIFYECSGIDFLSFQIYNIFSKINDNELLNIFLYETLSFVMELILYKDKDNNNINILAQKSKLESEMDIFFLTLLNSLINQKEKFYLNNNLIMELYEIYNYFKIKKLINEKNMILSILLDIDFYKNKEDIFQYKQIFDSFKNELEEKSNDNKSIFNKEFLYKILILDFAFETKKNNHKILMEIISCFILFEEENKHKFLLNELILYFSTLKIETKIYHYLKIIYFNFDKIKNNLMSNAYFKILIKKSIEKINYKHCKYCVYNQILFYLLYQEIINENNINNSNLMQTPKYFLDNPTLIFLKCLFSQIFSLSFKDKFKFMKLKSNEFDFILSLIDKNKEIFDFVKFTKKFENIINYLKSLMKKENVKDIDFFDIIFNFIKFMLNFIKRITKNEIDNIHNNVRVDKTNVEKNEIHKRNLKNLLSSETMKKFFDIYININNKEAIEEINNLIKTTINYISFPFYFLYFSNKSIFNINSNENNILQVFKNIIDKLTEYKINFDNNKDIIMIKNNIFFVLCLYNFFINNNCTLNPELLPEMIRYLNDLKDKYYFYSKFIFYSNLNKNQIKQEKKFIIEIICDIYFHLYEKKKFDKVIKCLIEGIFLPKNNEILNIDIQYFRSNGNKNKAYIFYNEKYFENIAKGEDKQEIIFSIFFLHYLLEKYEKYMKQRKNKEPIEMISKIMNLLIDNSKQLFKEYKKKINYSLKNNLNNNKFKIYFGLLDFIKNNYKSKNFCLDLTIENYNYLKKKNSKKLQIFNTRINTDVKPLYPDFIIVNKLIKYSQPDASKYFYYEENENNYDLLFPKININERHKSFSHFSSRKTSFSEKYVLNEIDIKNDFKDDESIDKKSNIKLNKITNNQREEITKNLINLFQEEEIINNKIHIIKNYNLKEKLDEINITSKYFYKIFPVFEPNIFKKVFNPKEYYIWNKFNFILKDIIFSQKKFKYISKLFEIKYRKNKLTKSSVLKNREFALKYPMKLKNFVCDDYYRPFIKPDLNFYENKLMSITHSYLSSKFLINNTFEIDKIRKIKFPRIIPIKYDKNPTYKINCEYINNNGSYFGYIYLNSHFLLFLSACEKDPRKKRNSEMDIEKEKFYLYSYVLDERVIDKKKYIIMLYSELKEIVVRRFCFNYIGLEFFMKNNKSYLFNFFNEDNYNNFIETMIFKIWENKPRNDKNDEFIVQILENYTKKFKKKSKEKISPPPVLKMYIDEEINFIFIQNLPNFFWEVKFRKKHYKGKLSNFKYLLLLNKYSSRSYKDTLQYLIFPLLYMDIERKKERDLSKAIALNKDPDSQSYQEALFKIQNNYMNSGIHFNTHYSTSGFVLYYLVRMNPFTAGHIKLQSNKFDAPRRMFTSIYSYLTAVISANENRELIPEFFYSYEAFLNLNHVNLGYISDENIRINDLDTDDKNGIAEFIIKMRQQLERVNILPWVDNIFGCYQDVENENAKKIYNVYPNSSYEKNNKYEEMMISMEKEGKTQSEIIKNIKIEIDFIIFGICPVQLFKTCLIERKIEKYKSFRNVPISISNIQESKEINYEKNIQYFLNLYTLEKPKIFLIDNFVDNKYEKSLVIKSKTILNIFRLSNDEKENKIITLRLRTKNYLKIYPVSKMFCELPKDIFLSCRYLDKIIQINYSNKSSVLIYYENLVTSVELLSHKETLNNINNTTKHSSQVIFGDEKGNLNLVKIDYVIDNQKQNNLNETKLKLLKSIKAHNSLIQGILYVKRLNIIISYSEEGQITINNAFDFNIINIINLGKDFYIKDIKISKYDLIYVYCTNYQNEKLNQIKCYSLNGIKFTELERDIKIINYFIDETLLVIYENNLIESFNLYDLEGNPIYKHKIIKRKDEINIKVNNKRNEKLKKNINNKIIFCTYNKVYKSLTIIYDDYQVLIEEIIYNKK